MRRARWSWLVIGSGLLLALADCSPPPPDAYVLAYIYRYYDEPRARFIDEIFVRIDRDAGFAMLPWAALNADTLTEDALVVFDGYHTVYQDTTRHFTSQSYELVVDYGEGRAGAAVFFPELPAVRAPDSTLVLGLDQDLPVRWTRSAHAQWYYLSVYVWYNYADTAHQPRDRTVLFDTTLTDTAYTLGRDRIFPDRFAIDTLAGGGATVLVEAVNGPLVAPGQYGNITGDGRGFFTAINETAPRHFAVAPGLPMSAERGRREAEGWTRQRAVGD